LWRRAGQQGLNLCQVVNEVVSMSSNGFVRREDPFAVVRPEGATIPGNPRPRQHQDAFRPLFHGSSRIILLSIWVFHG
jgi:hypothetical protein